ncbi:sensor c-di-GMP phosphodiesterase-like protein [Erwinia toletana]|uniref:cyclic-guanylate-specific phosphodiesterase n=1 Tax=Winslowiella toletana TaxID=92490 RepID=A0ABS4P7U7_9GAMM|nr:sensor c-di-GMP phosphodiesterase-like protein [Winslowiella toletana]
MVASISKRGEHGWLLMLAAGLLPLLLGIFFTFVEAQQMEKRQQVSTAMAVLNQAENISDRAWEMVAQLQRYDHQTCNAVGKDIQRLGSIAAYFRSVGLTQDNEVLCSSAYGLNPGTINTMLRLPPSQPLDPEITLSVAGTAGVPTRPAVLFFRRQPEGDGAFALVDGQYLLDFMRALGEPRDYQITVQFNNGFRIASGYVRADHNPLFDNEVYLASSPRYPINVSVTSPESEAVKAWRQVFLTFLPMAAILSLLCMALASNWLKRRMSYQEEMRRAMAKREFSVNYQPVYDVSLATCGGAEALLRWQRADGEWVRPDVFIAAAEAEGMIIPLTQHLLEMIASDVASWEVPPGFHLGINVAAEHLQDPCFVDDIRRFIARVADKSLVIILELTERSLISDGEEVVNKLAMLRREGVEIAIDDFGTGNCSLSYLQTFELDYLKIDRGFVNAIESVDGETPVLDAIINLSHKLELTILGEGVETAMQFTYLENHGVRFIQGYLYARPMNNEAFSAWLQNDGRQPAELLVNNP